MNQKRTTKQALLFSVLALALCFCMLIGSTFAWFTDSVSSDKNTIVAGNLDIALEYYKDGNWSSVEGATDIFNPAAKWEPGHAEVVYLRARNDGNLALQYVLGIKLAGEVAGTNVAGQEFKLSDYLMFDIIENVDGENAPYADRDEAIAATSGAKTLQESLIANNNADGLVSGKLENQNDEKYVAVVVWMPTSVGNEANYKKGTVAPSIDLGVSIAATQVMNEEDGFGSDYDADATLPNFGTGSYTIVGSAVSYPIEVRGSENQKLGSFEVPADAIAAGVTTVEGTITEVAAREGNFTVAAGETLKSYEVEVSNVKENNEEKIRVMLRIADPNTFIDEASLKVYHNGVEIDAADLQGYNPYTGYVTFHTTSFSPFDVIFEIITEEEWNESVGDATEGNLPQATVTRAPEYENVEIAWGSYGQWSPDPDLYDEDNPAMLEAAYKFLANDTKEEAAASPYANWNCDFFVSLNKDLAADQIFLGGYYDSFGAWVGFNNGDLTLEADTEIPLLGSVSGGWTYLDVVNNVREFICGVADVNDALAGATFTVVLRLTSPDGSVSHDIATINYTFPAAE